MPRQSKGARLELRPERRDRGGKLTHHATWRIRDGDRDIGTGCAQSDLAGAEQKLVDYLAAKHQPERKIQDIESVEIADVLLIYLTDRRSLQQNKLQFDRRIKRLNDWWGGKKLSEVTGDTCRAYQRQRGNAGGSRRDLEDLRAAINYHASEGLHRGIVKVVLPPKGPSRDRWLTRDEAARLLWVCWRYRELQRRGRRGAKGPALPTAKRPLRHLARVILIGLYTGTRAAANCFGIPAAGHWTLVRRFKGRTLLPPGNWQPRNDETATDGAHPAPFARAYATLAGTRDHQGAFRRIQRQAG